MFVRDDASRLDVDILHRQACSSSDIQLRRPKRPIYPTSASDQHPHLIFIFPSKLDTHFHPSCTLSLLNPTCVRLIKLSCRVDTCISSSFSHLYADITGRNGTDAENSYYNYDSADGFCDAGPTIWVCILLLALFGTTTGLFSFPDVLSWLRVLNVRFFYVQLFIWFKLWPTVGGSSFQRW